MSPTSLTQDGHLDAVRTALRSVRPATGLPVAFGGGVTHRGDVRVSALAGTTSGVMRGLQISRGAGLGGKVAATGRPARVDDYVGATSITHIYDHAVVAEGLRSVIAAPVLVGQTVRAVLYGANRDATAIGDRSVAALCRISSKLAQEITIRDEVERRLADTTLRPASTTDPRHLGREWEQVREAHAELRRLAKQVDDEALRVKIQVVCDQLACSGTSSRIEDESPLTPRERDVLAEIAMGHTNAQAADRLGLLPETVKSYLRSAM